MRTIESLGVSTLTPWTRRKGRERLRRPLRLRESIGVCEGGPTRALLDEDKPNPSVVWFRADGDVIVGRKAKENLNKYSEQPGNTFVSSVKVHLGNERSFRVAGQPKKASEVAAEVFGFLLRQARDRHSLTVQEGVVTIPVDFHGQARHELRSAAEQAGFYVKTFIHEPFAAVVAYCLRQQGQQIADLEGRNILVFDWGGGTLDITLAAVRAGRMIQVAKATSDTGPGIISMTKSSGYPTIASWNRPASR